MRHVEKSRFRLSFYLAGVGWAIQRAKRRLSIPFCFPSDSCKVPAHAIRDCNVFTKRCRRPISRSISLVITGKMVEYSVLLFSLESIFRLLRIDIVEIRSNCRPCQKIIWGLSHENAVINFWLEGHRTSIVSIKYTKSLSIHEEQAKQEDTVEASRLAGVYDSKQQNKAMLLGICLMRIYNRIKSSWSKLWVLAG